MPDSIRLFLSVSSPLSLKALERLLALAPEVEVVGVARSERETLALLPGARAHLLCIDDAKPGLCAASLAREVMSAHPCPILVLGAAPDAETRRAVLEAGALELLARPNLLGAPDAAAIAAAFTSRLKLLSRVPVIGRRASGQVTPHRALGQVAPRLVDVASVSPLNLPSTASRIVAIGASTGGPQALLTILSALPADFPLPVVCVQHVSRGFLEGLVSWLDEACRVRVAIAQGGEKLRAGTVLFPPEDRHLEVGANGHVRLSCAPARDGHRPSASVLFESVAASFGSGATAVLLTGMGADGAGGLLSVRAAGGTTIAQDEASCVVFGMPRVAIERGAACYVWPPDEIARRLLAFARQAA